jgi:uncharacterized repeat protein (TIGR01451 family)
MKRILSLSLFLLIAQILHAQIGSLVSIAPNASTPGQPLTATITGSGTVFMNSSPPSGIMNVYLSGPLTINSPWPWLPTDDEHVDADFFIPPNAPIGAYDVNVEVTEGPPFFGSYVLTLPGAFNVGNPDGYVQGSAYLDANQNGVKDAGEDSLPGQSIRIMPSNYTIATDINGNYSFPVMNGTHTVSWEVNLSAYLLRTSDSASFTVTVNNDTVAGNDFGLKYSLISATPNQGLPGQTVTLAINSDSAFVGSILQVNLVGQNGSNATSFSLINPDSATATFNLPPNAVAGSYQLGVWTYNSPFQKYHYLPDAFSIVNGDGAIKGTIYIDDNLNGVMDAGEPGATNQRIRIMPDNILALTDASGNYKVQVLNGSHDVSFETDTMNIHYLNSLPATYTVTVNNDTVTGNDFGVIRGLISVTPNIGYQGQTVNVTISARDIFDTTGIQGNINQVYIKKGFYQVSSSFANINVVDSNIATATFVIPTSSSYLGVYELYVVTNGNTRVHRLPNAFTVAVYPYYASGNIYYDLNGNGAKDAGEYGLPYERILLNPDSVFYFADYQGNYSAGFATGTHSVAWSPGFSSPFVLSSSPSSYGFTAPGSVTGLDFGLVTTNANYSSDIFFWSGFPRCNQNVTYRIQFENTGPVTDNGKIYFRRDPLMTYVSSTVTPLQFSGDTIIWSYSNLQPFTWQEIDVVFTMPGAGNIVHNYAAIYPFNGSAYVLKDSVGYNQTIMCSFDPNDKAVVPEGIQAPHYTLMTDTLEYLIRFQNTGNDTAFNVTIIDYIDDNLDLSTFRVIGSSHSVQTEVKSTGEVRFSFQNILLPDSNVNEPASHGFVSCRIAAKSGLPDLTPVNNTGYIIFDSNAPVVTNTTLNTLVTIIPSGVIEHVNKTGNAIVYPNPFDKSATLLFKNDDHESFVLTITDLGGKIVMEKSSTADRFIIESAIFKPGLYLYTLFNSVSKEKQHGKFAVKKQD